MKFSTSIRHLAQYTALVDILFATIGVFVIVFVLQDLDPPEQLQPAPYDHLIICDTGRELSYSSAQSAEAIDLERNDLGSGRLRDLLSGGGRVLIALAPDCIREDDGGGIASALRDLENDLSDRPATDLSPLTLFEFAPLGQDENGAEAIRQRFLSGGGL